MSIDTTFHPISPSVAFTNAAAVQPSKDSQLGVTTFRVTNHALASAAGSFFSWGPTNAVAVPTTAGVNTMFVPGADSLYIEIPGNSWFIGAAGSSFSVIGGIGGVGG